jgi:hypothetical protein
MWNEVGDRLAVLGDYDSVAGAFDLIHQGQTFGLEFGCLDHSGHWNDTPTISP